MSDCEVLILLVTVKSPSSGLVTPHLTSVQPTPSQRDDTNQTVVTANMSSTLLIALAQIEWNLLSLSEASLV